MARDVEGFLLLEMRDLDKFKSKLEIIMEQSLIPVNISMVFNHCKNLL